MKYLTLFSTILAVASAAPLAEEAVAQDVQAKDPGLDMTAQGVKILPRFIDTPLPSSEKVLKRITKKYGTYTVSSSKMLSTTRTFDGPCKGIAACYVTAMEATIRYPDGKEANVDTGAWLHHIALSSTRLQPIWACGNERPTLRLNSNGKYGFEFPDTFGMMIDLMVEGPTAKTLTLELSYEYVLKTNPDYKPAAVHWLTLGMDRAAQAGSYSFDTQSSAVAAQSKLLYAIGHMHDGGTDMQLFVENGRMSKSGQMVCKSVMHYGGRAGYGGTAGHSRRDGHGGHGGGEHISDPGACTDFGTVSKGQYLRGVANYNADTHQLMEINGKKEALMGNMRVYVGPI